MILFAGYINGDSSAEVAAGVFFAIIIPFLFLALSLYLVVKHMMLVMPDQRKVLYMLSEDAHLLMEAETEERVHDAKTLAEQQQLEDSAHGGMAAMENEAGPSTSTSPDATGTSSPVRLSRESPSDVASTSSGGASSSDVLSHGLLPAASKKGEDGAVAVRIPDGRQLRRLTNIVR